MVWHSETNATYVRIRINVSHKTQVYREAIFQVTMPKCMNEITMYIMKRVDVSLPKYDIATHFLLVIHVQQIEMVDWLDINSTEN